MKAGPNREGSRTAEPAWKEPTRNLTRVPRSSLSKQTRSESRSLAAPRPFRKRAVLVLGMHRSGTSAVTRWLNLLGVDLPSNLIPSNRHNMHGFWEPYNIVKLHDELLAATGSSWDDTAAFPGSWFDSDVARTFQECAVWTLRAILGESRLFVLKDPRICRLVPFWRSVLNEFEATPHFIIQVRHPLEVTASLKSRNGFPTAKSLLLWLQHLLEAERETRGQRRTFVDYSQLLGNWRGMAERVSQDLELSWPRPMQDAAPEIEKFLSESARHHSFSIADLESRSGIVERAKRAYTAIVANDGDDARLAAVLDDVRSRLQATDHALDGYPLKRGPNLDERAATRQENV